jgi:hypothetical protein
MKKQYMCIGVDSVAMVGIISEVHSSSPLISYKATLTKGHPYYQATLTKGHPYYQATLNKGHPYYKATLTSDIIPTIATLSTPLIYIYTNVLTQYNIKLPQV